MALAPEEITSCPITYEEYLSEGEINRRYDIIDGVRVYKSIDMTSPTWRHQRILKNISRALGHYEDISQGWNAAFAPLDILIRRESLRVRQPDALLISEERLARIGGPPASGPLTAAPELVVEILSSTDTRRVLSGKIADYCEIGVQECWVVSPEAETVEVLRLTQDGPETVAVFAASQTLVSDAIADLTVAVSAFFAA